MMRNALITFCFLLANLPASANNFTTLKGHGGPIMGLAVSPDGVVASASFDNSVGLWAGGAATWLEGHDAAVVAVDYSEAPVVVSGGDDFRVLVWAPYFDSPLELTKHQGKVAAIAIAPDQAVVATAGWDGFINVTSVVDLMRTQDTPAEPIFNTEVLDGHRSNVTDVEFAPDGMLYSASADGTIREWDSRLNAQSGSRVLITHGFGINQLIVEEDWIAYGAVDGGTRAVNRETGDVIADLTLERRPILAMAYHAETSQLAVGDGQGYIMMIDTSDWSITHDFRAARQGPVWALAFSPDGETIYAGGLDDVIYAWPVSVLDEFDPAIDGERTFLREADSMPNGERQFMRKCSICHSLEPDVSRKAGPTLHGVFGREAGTLEGYRYSDTLLSSEVIWSETTIDALFDEGPDEYIPDSKMPMQRITGEDDRRDLIEFLLEATQ